MLGGWMICYKSSSIVETEPPTSVKSPTEFMDDLSIETSMTLDNMPTIKTPIGEGLCTQ